MKLFWINTTFIFFLFSCTFVPDKDSGAKTTLADSSVNLDSLQAKADFEQDNIINKDTVLIPPKGIIKTGNTKPAEIVAFAKTLIGTPYLYGSTNPANGFDCSGFITYVFNRFGIAVPRSSVDFTNVGKYVSEHEAKEGDLILFTGTNPMERRVGHMGIITSNRSNEIEFIHSTSGKAYGVTISPLSDYYKTRFVKIIRLFPQNDQ